ncbi:helix-turn-helix transcriptional regulator [Aureibacillus halotolerans]|uniref:Transcriptional regulator n=1 Tax=Aureibacillus halotolerans TaxID=1508390 RepID=A0A4R6TPL3_9BACI|nr:helix-turn-helix transcriptional regulator [Aureibacillus halotolerans]TDQ34119.1 transcriptional regulator [Aureibacillus halotolerans]
MKKSERVLSNNLYLLRAEKRWTQKYVAEQLGVTRQTIHSLEANKYNPSLVLAFDISQLYEKSIDEIFSYEKKGERE